MQLCINNYDRFLLFAKFQVIMCLTHVQERWYTTKNSWFWPRCLTYSLVWMYPQTHKDIFLEIMITFFFGGELLIWNASKSYNDVKFCQEAKTIIVVNTWLNSLTSIYQFYLVGQSKGAVFFNHLLRSIKTSLER